MEDRTQAGQLGEALGARWGAAAPSPRPRPPPQKLSEPRPSGLDRHLTGRGRTAAGSASPPQSPDPRLVAETTITDTPSSHLPVHSSRSEGSENERTKERCRGSEATARAPGPLLRLQEGSAVTAGSPPAWTARPPPRALCSVVLGTRVSLLERQSLDRLSPHAQSPSLAAGPRPSGLVCGAPERGRQGPSRDAPGRRRGCTHPHELLGEGPAGVLRHVDGGDDPVPFLPPQAAGELLLLLWRRWRRPRRGARGPGGVLLRSCPPLLRRLLERGEEPRLW